MSWFTSHRGVISTPFPGQGANEHLHQLRTSLCTLCTAQHRQQENQGRNHSVHIYIYIYMIFMILYAHLYYTLCIYYTVCISWISTKANDRRDTLPYSKWVRKWGIHPNGYCSWELPKSRRSSRSRKWIKLNQPGRKISPIWRSNGYPGVRLT